MVCLKRTVSHSHSVCCLRSPEPHLPSEETQDQPKASHTFYHLAAPGTGEEVPAEAVPLHRWAGGILHLPHPDRDPGQDLVPEPPGQSQAAPGGWAGKTEDGCWCQEGCFCGRHHRGLAPCFYITAVARRHVAVWADVFYLPPAAPQIRAAHLTSGPVYCSTGLRHVPLILKMEISLTLLFPRIPGPDVNCRQVLVDVFLTLKMHQIHFFDVFLAFWTVYM